MKKLIPLLVLAACGATPEKPEVMFANTVNGTQHYVVAIPVRDDASPYSVTPYDQNWILRTETCTNAFQETKIEYAPLSDDGVSTKLVTFYCL